MADLKGSTFLPKLVKSLTCNPILKKDGREVMGWGGYLTRLSRGSFAGMRCLVQLSGFAGERAPCYTKQKWWCGLLGSF